MMTADFAVGQSSLRASALLLDPPGALRRVPPDWVMRLLGHASRHELPGVQLQSGGELTLLHACVPDVVEMSADEMRQAAAGIYANLGNALATIDRSPVRMWNYMPHPTERLESGRDRYMAFNQGRHDGYHSWPARGGRENVRFSTASAVGIDDRDLTVFCLASVAGGEPIENPRQIPAWRNSARYGPASPSFARATATTFPGRRLLLIGGTASVVGEDTAHAGDIRAQTAETLENLAAVIASANETSMVDGVLHGLTDVRVYLTRPDDAMLVREQLLTACPRLDAIELVLAPLCRRDLLVEIEGVAELTRPA
jgi:chorismate lyase/3-hydroxybenzoate synthase